ncbi:MAG TPA: beta-ketoacyl-[acyl-carrier-protein] synthase family protein [Accumulibacter sp.]|nr:beta-ketoacyl-[acyl-carrier-protein] synthase family protein [Accumulibacter sp.]HMW18096.1 beta-ketoacyl-[acyl-carrier-protein] synthase family protein [Accumulibacter sp.]HMX22605.1 beta-ketoacyl-[acyl-carrier-protein] synthase family protein [Accumulibacter sp.]HMY07885.1 beta-ketoacyl-[acyl-carrier-protein] synthase family protein [Accumulibacter sp.]HNC17192.1 beta-ketoacyl-[acyl-carrier-protein] synthase family protein [Accumulibacter sp.]
MSAQRVAVTGLGLVSPFGGNADDFFQRLLAGESAIRFLRTDDVPRPIAIPFASLPAFDPQTLFDRSLLATMDRFAQFGLAAALDAWRDAGLSTQPANGEHRDHWGVIWGTALGGILAIDKGYRDLWLNGRQRLSPLAVVQGMNNAANAQISIRLGLGGPSVCHAVACASSAIAVGDAFRRVRSGEASVMVAGGSEAPQAYSILRAWEALRVLAHADEQTAAKACRPFSADRDGLVLGEGGAALVLENWQHALDRGARIHAELVGYGSSCDHDHLVRPNQDGQVRALRLALADAGLSPAEIDYVNAHGTATAEGDPVECQALQTVFGDLAARLPVSGTKGAHGHLLGAAGALEALITVLALREQAIPPTANLHDLDPECAGVDHVTQARTGQPLRAALSSSFAFGGSNAVLAFRACAQ